MDRRPASTQRPWVFLTACWLLAAGWGALADDPPAVSRSKDPARTSPSPESTEAYGWDLPRGFPEPKVPADNPMSAAKVALGRLLFFDERLSGNGTASCASCHRPELAFTDGRARALGSTHEVHPRSSMSLANVAYNATLTWADPDLTTLAAQALVPMLNEDPVELGLAGLEVDVARRLADDPETAARFAAAFPGADDPFTLENIARALASFQRTLLSGSSAYDRMVYHDDLSGMSAAALRGMDLFFSERLGCSDCHAGFNFSGPVDFVGSPPVAVSFHNTGLYNLTGLDGSAGAYPPDNQGLVERTGRPEDMGAFRAPTLRNIAVTAPYMHDGSLATLDEVLDHYAAGGRTIQRGPLAGIGRDNPLKSPLVTGFVLAPGERRDLIAFLESLTDRAFLEDPRFTDPDGANPLLESP